MPCEGIENFRIDIFICVVEKETPIAQHISSTQTIWQMLAGDEKSIPALIINIFWDMTYSIPNMAPTQFQVSIPPPITH
jgi:hypothetical protein